MIGLLLLVLGVVGRATPMATPEGRQCPTAAAPLLRVAIRSACGCVIGHIERAPRPGERGFVQCRCNEKRAAQESSAPPAPALPMVAFRLELPVVPLVADEYRYVLGHAERSVTPVDRPPTVA